MSVVTQSSRYLRAVRALGALGLAGFALAASGISASCSTFSPADDSVDSGSPSADSAATDAPGACNDTCSGPDCKSWDFTGSKCPSDLVVGGDDTGSVTIECNGDLRVFADSTLDKTAELQATAPSAPYTIRASTTVSIAEWQGVKGGSLPVITISADGVPVATVRATSATTSGQEIEYSLCMPGGQCKVDAGRVKVGESHRVALEVANGEVTLFVNCKKLAAQPTTVPLPVSSPVKLRFGSTDGDAIDGKFDDVIIAFTRS
jgi:hypothetical protein